MGSKRFMSGNRLRWTVLGGCLIAVATAVAAHELTERNLRTRLLVAVPDQIASNSELRAFAIPRGRAAFDEHCASCHGVQLKGDPGRGVPDLTDRDWLYGSGRVGEIERVILYGIRSGDSKSKNLADMPAFGSAKPYSRYEISPLTYNEVSDVTALLYSFQHPGSVDAATLQRGEKVYHETGICFDCHADHAKGDPAIGAPNLTDGIWLVGNGSMESIRHSVEFGLSGVCPEWISRLDPATVRAIAVYVSSQVR